ncbi:hypothetical protein [Streptomyces fradiae]
MGLEEKLPSGFLRLPGGSGGREPGPVAFRVDPGRSAAGPS